MADRDFPEGWSHQRVLDTVKDDVPRLKNILAVLAADFGFTFMAVEERGAFILDERVMIFPELILSAASVNELFAPRVVWGCCDAVMASQHAEAVHLHPDIVAAAVDACKLVQTLKRISYWREKGRSLFALGNLPTSSQAVSKRLDALREFYVNVGTLPSPWVLVPPQTDEDLAGEKKSG